MVKNFKNMPKPWAWETAEEYAERMQKRIDKRNKRRKEKIETVVLIAVFVVMCGSFVVALGNHKENYWVENPGHGLIDGLYCHEHVVDTDWCDICQEVIEWN